MVFTSLEWDNTYSDRDHSSPHFSSTWKQCADPRQLTEREPEILFRKERRSHTQQSTLCARWCTVALYCRSIWLITEKLDVCRKDHREAWHHFYLRSFTFIKAVGNHELSLFPYLHTCHSSYFIITDLGQKASIYFPGKWYKITESSTASLNNWRQKYPIPLPRQNCFICISCMRIWTF